MMNQENYHLGWKNYADHLKDMLYMLFKSNEQTDVTIVCDDKKQIKAHKIVLSACSTVFKSIINDLPQYNSVIYLKGIQHQEMECILEFMYQGVTTFNVERIDQFFDVAQSLEIKEIGRVKANKFEVENLTENIRPEQQEVISNNDVFDLETDTSSPPSLHYLSNKFGFTNYTNENDVVAGEYFESDNDKILSKNDPIDDTDFVFSFTEEISPKQEHKKSNGKIKSENGTIKDNIKGEAASTQKQNTPRTFPCDKCEYVATL